MRQVGSRCRLLLSELATQKTVRTKFLPWLSGESPWNILFFRSSLESGPQLIFFILNASLLDRGLGRLPSDVFGIIKGGSLPMFGVIKGGYLPMFGSMKGGSLPMFGSMKGGYLPAGARATAVGTLGWRIRQSRLDSALVTHKTVTARFCYI